MLAAPRAASGPSIVRAVTVRLVRTKVIAVEVLMLDTEQELFP